MECVLAVDGINVIDGDPATLKGPGYVLKAGVSATIPGWRRGEGAVAKFTFENPENGYAAQMGLDTSLCQSVSMAVFSEKPKPQPRTPSTLYAKDIGGPVWRGGDGPVTRGMGNTLGPKGVQMGAAVAGVSAGYGAEKSFATKETTFERAGPMEIYTVEYATRAQLASWGITIPQLPAAPQVSTKPTTAVKAPPGWVG
jgi:hypothetical protein